MNNVTKEEEKEIENNISNLMADIFSNKYLKIGDLRKEIEKEKNEIKQLKTLYDTRATYLSEKAKGLSTRWKWYAKDLSEKEKASIAKCAGEIEEFSKDIARELGTVEQFEELRRLEELRLSRDKQRDKQRREDRYNRSQTKK